MKINLVFCTFILFSLSVVAQEKETFTNDEYTVVFQNEDPNFNPDVKDGLIKTFFLVYPKMVEVFNPKALKSLEIKIDTAYTGVAYANNGKITISSEWLRKKPEDLDVITHEVMHIVQSYPNNSGPGWLTEGIADYVRYKYGNDNKSAGWSLPEYTATNHYTRSYRVTARFLLWTTQQFDEDLVVKMDRNLREKTYTSELWIKYTDKTLDELWEEYSKNPGII
jgi:sulfur carrier protein ThiS